MIAIEMGGCDIVLGVEWLQTWGSIVVDFGALDIRFH